MGRDNLLPFSYHFGSSVGIAKIPRGIVSCIREHARAYTLENAEDELMYEIKANQQIDSLIYSISFSYKTSFT